MQPSAQGIASLYMGNPGALQQKVQKEQQANPGLPPDLKKLMALNIVTNEQDAAKRQEAMTALQQMAPGGQPPTVAQSIQEQAKQKLQAQALQQARQQQGLQALAQSQQSGQAPEGTPSAEPQAGIDQLPVEMGLAGGGLVAFAGGDEVEEIKGSEVTPGEQGYGWRYFNDGTSISPDGVYYKDGEVIFQPEGAKQKGLAAAAPYQRILQEALGSSPEAARATAAENFKKAISAPDVSQIDRLIAELEGRKAQMVAPKTGLDAFGEYMAQIAAAGPSRSSFEAGAKGAAGVRALEKERQQQQFDITKQQIEAAQRKADLQRAYEVDAYKAGQEEYKSVFDRRFKALTESGLDERNARDIASREAEQAKDRTADMERTRITAGAPGQTERITAQIRKLRSEGKNAEADELMNIYASITGSGAAGVGAQRNAITQKKAALASWKYIRENAETDAERKEAMQNITRITRELVKLEEGDGGLSMSMDDVRATAKASGKSEADIIAAAKAKGYTIK